MAHDPRDELHQELPTDHPDTLISAMHRVIQWAVKVLAALMVMVILLGVADVVYVLYQKLVEPPMFLLDVNDIFYVFGAFMVVLIAIEIFINIRLYLGSHVFPVKLVVATALMAIARKIIILDVEKLSYQYVLAIGVTLLALGITYWLLTLKPAAQSEH
ncbi:phosphate-starvation-inducible PsiE family protein [Simiduia agarivorans]|uniref:Protein PsiE n=1 Tax=Simiduia agarivorans (strain DSM 21679 / JCM 13881 / BCRC 17597 / SA1) TaxID=1117647 RepID=K4L1G5_SIMAS|nr:phosphate-starvation-inducible PsiE family protein [Simiduia agarivorans]AFV00018.1 hypothetical protein M5M_14405 [Simiduia agarivorans SA1 = DSM 21679]